MDKERSTRGVEQLPIQHAYQNSERFKQFEVAEGFSRENFCWLACLDMVLSKHEPGVKVRDQLLTELISAARDTDLIDVDGRFSGGKDVSAYLEILNDLFETHKYPMEVDEIPTSGFFNELQAGNILLIPIRGNIESGHALLFDKMYIDREGEEAVAGFWDPLVENSDMARGFLSSGQKAFIVQGNPVIMSSAALRFKIKANLSQ